MDKIKDNAILTIKCPEAITDEARRIISEYPKIKESKVISIIDRTKKADQNNIVDIQTVNHLEAFVTYIKDNLTINDLLLSELSEVCKWN